MKPVQHFAISILIGTAIGIFLKSLWIGIICFFSGFLLDLDHILEYIIHFGWKDFSLKNCYLACAQTNTQKGKKQFKKLYFIFHSMEIAIGLWLLGIYTNNFYIFAFALGHCCHLLLDSLSNPVYIYSYFLLWRAKNKFDTHKLMRDNLRNAGQ